ncbi:MAG: GNAT family N-acetyltransferase [Chloroflexi bacterium]|nr:GNAT family N-acetyltransferase [Chloroflexota bacterium]MBU1746258.1 GNAT family N-acetyltransferase [Chloroflexota bacterium]
MTDARIRTYQPEDLDALVALINAADAVDQAGFTTTARRLQAHLNRPGRDPARDMFLAELGGQLVGYARLDPRHGEREDVVRCEGVVLPAYRRRGIGAELLRRAYQRAGELRGTHPAHFDIHARQNMPGINELCASFGMQPMRYFFWMVHPDLSTIAEPTFPPGFRLVDGTAFHDLAARTAAFNEAFARHWEFTAARVEDAEYMARQPTYQPANSLTVLDEVGAVAGFCTVDTTPDAVLNLGGDTGQVSILGVRPAYRGRGLGQALLLSAMHNIRFAGPSRAALGVDGDNVTGAKHLYESVGFREANRSIVYRREVE